MIGTTVSHYKILEKLGEGGMGVVYKAQDTKLDRVVALKFLPRHLTSKPEDKARFLQEAKAAAALNHPNICTIYGIEEHDEEQFIAMEYIDGKTLRDSIGNQQSAIANCVSYAIQIGEALHEAHSKGIVHRDIKADNVMVNAKNQVKVMDFGLAKLRGSVNLTRSASTVGTLAYMAPEQIQGGAVDARSDIFAFGVLFFQMLTGRLPFRGEHDAAMMYSIVNETPESLVKHLPDASPDLVHIVNRLLEKHPDDRYQSMNDAVIELRRLRRDTSRVMRIPDLAKPSSSAAPSVASSTMPSPLPIVSKRTVFVGGMVLAGVALLIAAYMFFGRTRSIDSLAVLPFENVGASADQEYLSDGVTESIINNLTKISSLRVVPRSTVFRFKGKELDIQDVGAKLNVAAVLSGRITHRGQSLDVQVDLIDVKRESQLWGNRYQSSTNDLLSLQQQITRDVSERLGISISSETRDRISKPATDNTQAFQLYMQGRYFWNKRTPAGIDRAIDYFSRAISFDSTFTLAYAGLADSYLIQPQYSGTPTRIAIPLAQRAAEHALALDNSMAEVHTSLAFAYYSDWRYAEAEREFKQAIALNPKYPTAYHWYYILLFRSGRVDEASVVIHKAQELDPYSPIIALNVGVLALAKKDHEEALRLINKSTEMDPMFAAGYSYAGVTLMRMNRYEEAEADLRKAVELGARSSEYLGHLGYLFARRGRRNEALKVLSELEQRYRDGIGAAYSVAEVYAGWSDKEKTLTWLEQDVRDRSTFVTNLKVEHLWDDIRTEPRFIALLKQVGLEQ